MNLELEEARELLREIIAQITQKLPLLEEGNIQGFMQESQTVMEQIQILKDNFLHYYVTHLYWSDLEDENPIAYMVFLAMTEDEEVCDIFEDVDEFKNALYFSGTQGRQILNKEWPLSLKEIVFCIQVLKEEEAREILHEVIAQITENLPILKQGDIKAFLNACLPAIYQIEKLNDHFSYCYSFNLLVEDCNEENPLAYVIYYSLSGIDHFEVFEDDNDMFDEWLKESSETGTAIYDHGTDYSSLTLDQISAFMQK